MVTSSRAVVTYGLGLVGGAALFFLSFAAVFNGVWSLLVLFVLCYAGAGALGVRLGGAAPAPLAVILALPAVPWILWLFPASIPEAGLLRALLWPALLLIMWALAWLGGWLASARALRLGPGAPAA
jgi:hypothetical protein